jgi:hypothetical protein
MPVILLHPMPPSAPHQPHLYQEFPDILPFIRELDPSASLVMGNIRVGGDGGGASLAIGRRKPTLRGGMRCPNGMAKGTCQKPLCPQDIKRSPCRAPNAQKLGLGQAIRVQLKGMVDQCQRKTHPKDYLFTTKRLSFLAILSTSRRHHHLKACPW